MNSNSEFYSDHQPPTTKEAAVSMTLRSQYVFYQGDKKKQKEKETPTLINVDLEEAALQEFPFREAIRDYSDYEVLSHVLEHRGWDEREGQIVMAETVGEKDDALISAPVGIGKTLGYLIPMLKNYSQVMVATSTKALQDQIAYSEMPRLVQDLDDIYGFKPRYTILKGKNNYLDVKRYEGLGKLTSIERDSIGLTSEADALIKEEIARLEELLETGEGSGYDSEALSEKLGYQIWRHINAMSSRSPYYQATLNKAYGESELIITNASYVVSVAANIGVTNFPLIGFPQAIVFDEAHHITDIVTDSLSSRLDIGTALARATKTGNIVKGIGPKTSDSFSELVTLLEDSLEKIEPISDDKHGREVVEEVALSLTEKTYEVVNDAISETLDTGGLPIFLDETVTDKAYMGNYIHQCKVESFQQFDALITFLEDLGAKSVATSVTATVMGEEEDRPYSFYFAIEDGKSGIEEYPIPAFSPIYLNNFGPRVKQALSDHKLHKLVLEEVDKLGGTGREDIPIPETPDENPSVLEKRQILMTSGTLSNGVQIPLGLEHAEYCSVENPFDPSKARLYVPDMKNEPRDYGWSQEAMQTALELVKETGGRAMILTTSRASLDAFTQFFRANWRESPVLSQGDMGKNELIDKFKEDEKSILIGTRSFWEGVDVPGPSLSLVIMDKIPFAYPSSAVKAREEYIRQTKGDRSVFNEVGVLDASQMFAQGAGRLIRSIDDVGGLAILDSRVTSKGYGKRVIGLMNPGTQLTEDKEAFKEWLSYVNPDNGLDINDFQPSVSHWRSAVPRPRRRSQW